MPKKAACQSVLGFDVLFKRNLQAFETDVGFEFFFFTVWNEFKCLSAGFSERKSALT